MSLFIDTPVLLYALGVESREREPCRRLISSSVDRGVRLHTDVEVLQEVLYHRLRRTTRERALAECRQLADNLVVHDITLEVWHRATDLGNPPPSEAEMRSTPPRLCSRGSTPS